MCVYDMCVCACIGLYIFKNMFLAILINRMANQDEHQVMIDDLLASAREFQRVHVQDGRQQFEETVKKVRADRIKLKSKKHEYRIKKIELRHTISGKSLGLFGEESNFRKILHDRLVNTVYFEYFINFLIILNCVFLAIDGPLIDNNSSLKDFLNGCNWAFTIVFVLEMFVKMIAFGVYS